MTGDDRTGQEMRYIYSILKQFQFYLHMLIVHSIDRANSTVNHINYTVCIHHHTFQSNSHDDILTEARQRAFLPDQCFKFPSIQTMEMIIDDDR